MDNLPLWLFFVLTVAFVMGAVELGRIFGGRIHRRSEDEKESTASAFVGTVLGLVAFILAFTFGIVTNRYDDRKALVLEEANAIGTAYLRADFLPEPDKTQTKQLFRDYLGSRVAVVQRRDLSQIKKLLAESDRIQQELWSMATSHPDNDTNAVFRALYAEALNAVLDVHSKRVAVGLHARVPLGIWAVLFILIFLGMLGVGYQMGISGSRTRSRMTPVLATSFSLVLLLIASLDRPTNSFISVSQQPLVELLTSMGDH